MTWNACFGVLAAVAFALMLRRALSLYLDHDAANVRRCRED